MVLSLTVAGCRLDDNKIRGSIHNGSGGQLATQLTFSTQPSSANLNEDIAGSTIVVQVKDASGSVVTSEQYTVTLSFANDPSGSALLIGTTSVDTVSGVATFSNLKVDEPGTGFTLNASATGLTSATSGSFDISGSQMMYRSVGPGTTGALALGTSKAVTISGFTATFASGLPDSVGVGDAIEYDSNNSGTVDALAFIHGRVSSTQYKVKSETGGAPTAASGDTDWSLYRAYTSLENAESGTKNTSITAAFDGWGTGKDITAGGGMIWNIALYADAIDDHAGAVTVNGWTTSATNYIRIYTPVSPSEVGVSQRHMGAWDTSKYLLRSNEQWTAALRLPNSYIRVEGLQIENTFDQATGDITGISLGGGTTGYYIESNIIRATNGTGVNENDSGIYFDTLTGPSTIYFANNIIENYYHGLFWDFGNNTSGAIYNNTLVNNAGHGVWVAGGAANHNMRIINNLSTGGGVGDYEVSGAEFTSNNISSDATSPDGAGFQSKTIVFENSGAGDFRLAAADTDAMGVGADLSADAIFAFNTDISGALRTTWDAGAYQTPAQTFSHTVQADFDAGTYTSGTEWSGTGVALIAPYGTSSPGTFTSSIVDSTSASTDWSFLKPTPKAPYGKELTSTTETAYTEGNGTASGLVGLWRFNGPEGPMANGTQIIDHSGQGHHGTVADSDSSITRTTGKLNQALTFAANNDRVDLGSPAGLDDLPAITAAAWIYPTATPDLGAIFEKRSGGTEGWYFATCHQNAAECNSFDNSLAYTTGFLTTDGRWYVPADSIVVNQWNFVAVVHDRTSDAATPVFYVNGVAVTTLVRTAPSGAQESDAATPFALGGRSSAGLDFDGSLDEMMLWNTQLSAAQILALYKRGAHRLKYQVRACTQSDCSDASFVGPDGSASSYFSELMNGTAGLPAFNLSPLDLTGRYFQYKALFETDDTAYTPELESLKLEAGN